MRAALVVLGLVWALSSGARAVTAPNAVVDLSADTLGRANWEVGLFWGRVARGMTPHLDLSTHGVAWLVGAPNVLAKWRFLDRRELRASIEGGAIWVASAALLTDASERWPLLLFLPVEARASLPLASAFELHLGAIGRWNVTNIPGLGLGTASLRMDVTLAHKDRSGTWLVTGRFPLVTRASIRLESLLGASDVAGAIALDELASFGFLIARDQMLSERVHGRFGVGYRNTYGIIAYESFGHLMLTFDLYWRHRSR